VLKPSSSDWESVETSSVFTSQHPPTRTHAPLQKIAISACSTTSSDPR
jgi:hypothetical protein